jgi:hypothetical protein
VYAADVQEGVLEQGQGGGPRPWLQRRLLHLVLEGVRGQRAAGQMRTWLGAGRLVGRAEGG